MKIMSMGYRRKREKGSEILEFSLVVAFILIPILLGVVIIGINLGRAVQVAQAARDAGSMYVRGIDFTQSGNQAILVRLGQGLGLATTGGTGVVILSKVTFIAPGGCTMPCNQNQYVMVQRVVVGNSSLVAEHGLVQSAGAVTLDIQGNVVNYFTNTNAVVSGFSSILALNGSEFAYIAEAYFPTPDLDIFRIGNGVYSRSIF